MPLEWKCGHCGAWVPTGYSRHSHVRLRQMSIDDMIAQRRAAELGGPAPDIDQAEVTNYHRTFTEPMRDSEDGQ